MSKRTVCGWACPRVLCWILDACSSSGCAYTCCEWTCYANYTTPQGL